MLGSARNDGPCQKPSLRAEPSNLLDLRKDTSSHTTHKRAVNKARDTARSSFPRSIRDGQSPLDEHAHIRGGHVKDLQAPVPAGRCAENRREQIRLVGGTVGAHQVVLTSAGAVARPGSRVSNGAYLTVSSPRRRGSSLFVRGCVLDSRLRGNDGIAEIRLKQCRSGPVSGVLRLVRRV